MVLKGKSGRKDLVLSERFGAVLLLTFNRPDRLNAWTNELEEQYFHLLDEAEADPEVRAIVVTGAGRGFSAGADMDILVDVAAEGVDEGEEHLPRPRWFPMTVRKPMIAAINGAAAGLGLVEALYSDIRFCAPEAKLTTSFSRRGLIAEHGSSWLLPQLVGRSKALDLLMSGRVILGLEAWRIGLVDRVVADEHLVSEAIAYAADLAANCSPTSMATIKAQVQRDVERSFVEADADADRLMLESLNAPDMKEGVASYVERRPPAFAPLATVAVH
jgi:enoyl-CoA hydratase/carnithine racemase